MAGTDPTPMLRVLRGLLRPLVRTLISHGVTAPALYRLLKSVYVEVAHSDFRIDDKAPTDSRVTLLTGVHRRDVRTILSDSDEAWDKARSKTATFATVLGQWLVKPAFLDAEGNPLALPRSGAPGADFETLVKDVNRDIRPRTILDELLRQGLVAETEDGLLRVVEDALPGTKDEESQIVFFAANVGDHLAAATDNLLSDTPVFLERAVFYNRLSAGSVDQIEEAARGLSQSALEDLNAKSSALQQADRDQADAHERYRFGVYFYRETAKPADTTTKKDNDRDEI